MELEAKAIQYGVIKCKHYLLGCPIFKVVTDHRPLVSVFKKYLDDTMNSRILKIREKLACFNFDVSWVPGKQHNIADALSRAPVFLPVEESDEDEVKVHVRMVLGSDLRLAKLAKTASEDPEYSQILEVLKSGLSLSSLDKSHPAYMLKSVWSNLSTLDDALIVLDGTRIYLPRAERQKVLSLAHKAHCGSQKTKVLMQQLYFWPGMRNEVEQFVQRCQDCLKFLPTQRVQPLQLSSASYPMERIGIDLFSSGGKEYLSIIDRFSGFPFAFKLRSTTTASIIKCLRVIFLDFGFPKIIRSDNGPQFRGEFRRFCQDRDIIHETSSPYNPQSNGMAECGVKINKYLLQKHDNRWEDFREGLFEWRNTPRQDGYSPAQLFFGRRQRTALPSLQQGIKTDVDGAIISRSRRERTVQLSYDKRAAKLPNLEVGDHVIVQEKGRWTVRGVVVRILSEGRSYVIEVPDAGQFRRNRRHIRKV